MTQKERSSSGTAGPSSRLPPSTASMPHIDAPYSHHTHPPFTRALHPPFTHTHTHTHTIHLPFHPTPPHVTRHTSRVRPSGCCCCCCCCRCCRRSRRCCRSLDIPTSATGRVRRWGVPFTAGPQHPPPSGAAAPNRGACEDPRRGGGPASPLHTATPPPHATPQGRGTRAPVLRSAPRGVV